MSDWNTNIIEEFRANNGVVGGGDWQFGLVDRGADRVEEDCAAVWEMKFTL